MEQTKKEKKWTQEQIIKNLPSVEKDVANHFMNNRKAVQQTMETILSRKLDNIEKDRLREHSMSMALQQVAMKYKKDLGLEEDLGIKVETKEKENEQP